MGLWFPPFWFHLAGFMAIAKETFFGLRLNNYGFRLDLFEPNWLGCLLSGNWLLFSGFLSPKDFELTISVDRRCTIQSLLVLKPLLVASTTVLRS